MKRIFIDANIVPDILLECEPWMDDALCLLSLADRRAIEVYCSSLSLATASYFMESVKMPHEKLMDKLDVFCQLCTPTTVDASVVKQAIYSSFHDFEDALQYYSSRTVQAAVIITRNGRDFANSPIPVMTAAEFLASFSESEESNTLTGYVYGEIHIECVMQKKEATGLNDLQGGDKTARKVLRNGVLYIKREGREYDLNGKAVR